MATALRVTVLRKASERATRAGRVLRKQDQKGDTCTMNYDLAGRLTSKNYRTFANSPSGTIADTDSFTYDKASRMLTAVSVRYVNTVTYTYDSAGRKKTEGLTISGQTYTTTTGYNAKGELTGYTYPDGTAVGRSYTARGELYQLTHAGTTIDTRVYDNGGRMTSSNSLSNTHRFRPTGRFPRSNQLLRTVENNGVSETRAYNTDNTLASISFTGASIGNLTYGWDANKNKTSEAIAGTMSNYGFTVPANGYDSEDRLVGFNRTSGLTQSWNLSLVGDWNSVTTNGTAQARTHGPTHELLTAGGQNVSTDVKGNMTFIPASLRPTASSLTSVFDFDNRLNTADVGNNGSIDVTYRFDALGRRVFRMDAAGSTVYVQAGQQTISDYTAGTAAASPTHRYVYASYIDEPVLRFKPSGSETLYYHRNQQYSVVALTNASAAIVERYAYSAYGVPTITNAAGTVLPVGSVNNRYMYTGREWDSVIAQYHYRARMYDANLGRFTSRDPIGFDGSQPNLQEYMGSKVLIYVDPYGLSACPVSGFNDWDLIVSSSTNTVQDQYVGSALVNGILNLWEYRYYLERKWVLKNSPTIAPPCHDGILGGFAYASSVTTQVTVGLQLPLPAQWKLNVQATRSWQITQTSTGNINFPKKPCYMYRAWPMVEELWEREESRYQEIFNFQWYGPLKVWSGWRKSRRLLGLSSLGYMVCGKKCESECCYADGTRK